MLRIGIVAGEVSGDMLAADLINTLKSSGLEVQLTGIGGEKLTQLGCQNLFPIERLSVMGISEVAGRLFELLKTRKSLCEYFINNPPDVFIGVDAPDFNFGLEKKLKERGIKTVHVVSPSIWAWREYRLKKIKKCVDLMLTLFPFENAFYEKYGIPVEYIGHPLAEKINMKIDRQAARRNLSLPANKKIVVLLPGSRRNELEKLSRPFIETAIWCASKRNDLCFITSLADQESAEIFNRHYNEFRQQVDIGVFTGETHAALEAADIALLASGTVALEALLFGCPMVVAYKLNRVSYYIARLLVKIPYVSLPNIIAQEKIVPEYLQSRCKPRLMGNEILNLLEDEAGTRQLKDEFIKIHGLLQRPASVNLSMIFQKLVNQ